MSQTGKEHPRKDFELTYSYRYAFDVMGRLAFGRDFGTLDSGEVHVSLVLSGKQGEKLLTASPVGYRSAERRDGGCAHEVSNVGIQNPGCRAWGCERFSQVPSLLQAAA